MNPFLSFLLVKKKFVLLAGGILIFALVLAIVNLFFFSAPVPLSQNAFQATPSPTQLPFSVISVFPSNGITNIYPGPIAIRFSTDATLYSKNVFQLSITPQPPHGFSYENTYPTREIIARVTDGLLPNTRYTITVLNFTRNTVFTSTFTTSSANTQDNPGVLEQQQQQSIKQFYPLFDDLPYTTNDFSIAQYAARLTLVVTVKIPDASKARDEVFSWIKSKGVDPSTHKIIYVHSE